MTARPIFQSAWLTPRLARIGVAGFAFFLLKGIAWLLVPAALAYFGGR